LPDVHSEIFLILGLDTISENQKLFARRVDLSQAGRKIALAREATQFAFRIGWQFCARTTNALRLIIRL